VAVQAQASGRRDASGAWQALQGRPRLSRFSASPAVIPSSSPLHPAPAYPTTLTARQPPATNHLTLARRCCLCCLLTAR
jgi:hypothetical protein